MIKNITKKELESKGFELKQYYGTCPVYEKDGIGFIFRQNGNDLTQIVNGFLNNQNMHYNAGIYVTERIAKMESMVPLGFDYLPHNYNKLTGIEREHAYEEAIFRLTNDKLDALIKYGKRADEFEAYLLKQNNYIGDEKDEMRD